MSSQRDPQPLTLEDVRDWFEAVRESIFSHRASVLLLFGSGVLTAPSRFFGLSRGEIEDDFDGQLSELESAAIMTLMASAEAAIRADYRDRVTKKRKDALSRKYAAFHKMLSPLGKTRPPLDTGILEALKESSVMPPHLIGAYRDSLRLRHWLAHGRYWTVNLGQSAYLPQDVYRMAGGLLSALPP